MPIETPPSLKQALAHLKIPQDATQDEAREIWQKALLRTHPDKTRDQATGPSFARTKQSVDIVKKHFALTAPAAGGHAARPRKPSSPASRPPPAPAQTPSPFASAHPVPDRGGGSHASLGLEHAPSSDEVPSPGAPPTEAERMHLARISRSDYDGRPWFDDLYVNAIHPDAVNDLNPGAPRVHGVFRAEPTEIFGMRPKLEEFVARIVADDSYFIKGQKAAITAAICAGVRLVSAQTVAQTPSQSRWDFSLSSLDGFYTAQAGGSSLAQLLRVDGFSNSFAYALAFHLADEEANGQGREMEVVMTNTKAPASVLSRWIGAGPDLLLKISVVEPLGQVD